MAKYPERCKDAHIRVIITSNCFAAFDAASSKLRAAGSGAWARGVWTRRITHEPHQTPHGGP
jgi:hypothetical protein